MQEALGSEKTPERLKGLQHDPIAEKHYRSRWGLWLALLAFICPVLTIPLCPDQWGKYAVIVTIFAMPTIFVTGIILYLRAPRCRICGKRMSEVFIPHDSMNKDWMDHHAQFSEQTIEMNNRPVEIYSRHGMLFYRCSECKTFFLANQHYHKEQEEGKAGIRRVRTLYKTARTLKNQNKR